MAGQAYISVTSSTLDQGISVPAYQYTQFNWPSDLGSPSISTVMNSLGSSVAFVYLYSNSQWKIWYNPSGIYGRYTSYNTASTLGSGDTVYVYPSSSGILRYSPAGCTNTAAHNYIASATSDDGSC